MVYISNKSFNSRILYAIRNFRSKQLFNALKQYCYGDVLDIGGWDFFLTAKKKKLNYRTWTTLDNSDKKINIKDRQFKFIHGDGCNVPFGDNKFDTVLNIQVLEHVFEPMKMIHEIKRVMKLNGKGIILIPQTSTLHMAPYHYYNFTKYWIIEATKQVNLEIIEIKPLGGFWSSIASRLIYFFYQSVKHEGMSSKDSKRNAFFYILFPIMAIYAIISILICMCLSIGDLTEEPNNHLVVVTKKNQD